MLTQSLQLKRDGDGLLVDTCQAYYHFQIGRERESEVQAGGEEQLVASNQKPTSLQGILFYQAKSTYRGLLHEYATRKLSPGIQTMESRRGKRQTIDAHGKKNANTRELVEKLENFKTLKLGTWNLGLSNFRTWNLKTSTSGLGTGNLESIR